MIRSNPALNALKGIVDNHDQTDGASDDHAIIAIVNGIKTCGPLYAAALCCDSMEIDKDIDEMLAAAKNLITNVNSELYNKSVNVTDVETATINAFCIRVISENWKQSQEIFDDWVSPIVSSLVKNGICAEYRSTDFNTLPGSDTAANIVAGGDIFSALNSDFQIPFDLEVYSKCIKELHKSANKAIEKLTQFHIPYEDADQIRHHITIQAGRIFDSVIRRELKHYKNSQRLSSISDSKSNEQIPFEEVFRHFRTSMDSFVSAIYVNSRMVN